MAINKIEIGSTQNFGTLTRYGFSAYDCPSQTYNDQRSYNGTLRHWRDYTVANCQYSDELQAAILSPTYDFAEDNTLSQVRVISGEWDECEVSNRQGKHLYAYKAVAGMSAEVESVNSLPAGACFIAQFTRPPALPSGESVDNQKWSISWGGDYKLEWSRTGNPKIYKGTTVISEFHLEHSDIENYAFAVQNFWKIYNINNQLYIVSDILPRTWVVGLSETDYKYGSGGLSGYYVAAKDYTYIGIIPAGKWKFYGAGGAFATKINQYAFATSGTIDTEWIEHYYPYADNEVNYDIFPAVTNPACNISVSILETKGNAKRYRVTLTGDGNTTPTLGAFQYRYAPTFATHEAIYTNITPWVDGGSITLAEDNNNTSANITLNGTKKTSSTNNQSLQEAAGYLAGLHSCKIYVGDGTTQQLKMTGFLYAHSDTDDVRDAERVNLTVDSIWKKLANTKLKFAPCVAGMRVDLAIKLIAQYGGIAPGRINNIAINIYLDNTDWANPHWLPTNGTSAGEFINQICNAYGVTCTFDEYGILQIYQGIDKTVKAILDPTLFSQSNIISDMSDAVNATLVEGMSPKGKPIYAYMYDAESLYNYESLRYIGFPVDDVIVNHDLSTQNSVNFACINNFNNRKAGWEKITLKSNVSPIWQYWPFDYLEMDNVIMRLSSLSITMYESYNETTAVLEVRP